MESSSKRRKLEHAGLDSRSHALIDFESPNSARLSTASTFILKADELLKSVTLDYGKAFKAADGHLHRLKAVVDSIEAHEPLPVSAFHISSS